MRIALANLRAAGTEHVVREAQQGGRTENGRIACTHEPSAIRTHAHTSADRLDAAIGAPRLAEANKERVGNMTQNLHAHAEPHVRQSCLVLAPMQLRKNTSRCATLRLFVARAHCTPT